MASAASGQTDRGETGAAQLIAVSGTCQPLLKWIPLLGGRSGVRGRGSSDPALGWPTTS